ncbi:DNA replication/repair protein RecF [Clostridium sp. BJN0001]|uniref:DNA replication/repair protein RecF n=1 Tax=Clostridium sp. BJN0001 TaxID=2930219 RepID=UPI001FD582D1|nr:DNA replication/repair protein RecF [Clostridium sp. BJN0001]
MYIKNIMLLNYRNYQKLQLEFSRNVNVFIGDNAQGKTNILEAVYFCAFAKSHRTSRDRELIKWNEEKAYISLLTGNNRYDKKIDISILKNGKKAIQINSIKIKKIGELFGTFNIVMFSPEDLKIIKESPGLRRRLMDMEISQINKKYYLNLVSYNKVLNERNIVLKNKSSNRDLINIYDEQLIEYADYIVKERLKYIEKVNFYGKYIHNEITCGKENIEFKYISNVNYLKDYKNNLKKKLNDNIMSDRERGSTSVGPHRDDFVSMVNNIDLKSYGSQGQQRTAILTMKFSSLKIINEIKGEYPVLLLDDVLSELDCNRQRYILNSIEGIQTVITCTGIENIKQHLNSNAKVFNIKNGLVAN